MGAAIPTSWTAIGMGPGEVVIPAGSPPGASIALLQQASEPALAATPTYVVGAGATEIFGASGVIWALALATPAGVESVDIDFYASAAGVITSNDGGAAITGAALPAGGSGLTGWLSAIWSKLAGTLAVAWSGSPSVTVANAALAVTGSFYPATQPVSLAAGLPAGSNAIGSVLPTANAVGSAAIATGQAAVGTSAAQLVAARGGASGTGRIAVTITNNGSVAIYIGGSSVTTAAGKSIPPGASLTLATAAAIYAIAGAASQAVDYVETY